MARPTLYTHRKFLRLIHDLAEPAPHVLGYLEFLWYSAYQSGDPIVGDATDVELAAKWPGTPGRLAEALATVGFLDRLDDGRFAIHDLADHAPEYVASRANREHERKVPKTCEHCGGEYRSADAKSRFCTNSCRQLAYLNRKRSHETPPSENGRFTERDESLGSSNGSFTALDGSFTALDERLTKVDGTHSHARARSHALHTESSARTEDSAHSASKLASARFKKPSIEEVESYCKQRGNSVDPEAFIDYYESNGWRVSKNPMRDWKATVRGWERRKFGANTNGKGATTAKPRVMTDDELERCTQADLA